MESRIKDVSGVSKITDKIVTRKRKVEDIVSSEDELTVEDKNEKCEGAVGLLHEVMD